MYQSKLLNTLKLFSNDEFNDLKLFLASPYYHVEKGQTEVDRLFKYLEKYKGDWNNPKLDRHIVYSDVFDGEKFVKGKMNKVMTLLLQMIHKFIIVNSKSVDVNGVAEQLQVAKFYSARKKNNYAKHHIGKSQKKSNSIAIADRSFYYNEFLLGEQSIENHLIDAKHRLPFDYPEALYPLDIYYLLVKLENACAVLSYDRFRQPIAITPLIDFLEKILPHYRAIGLLETPVLHTYYEAFEALRNEKNNEEAYWRLKKMVGRHEKELSDQALYSLHGIMRNFIIRAFNEGNRSLRFEVFALYKRQLEKGHLDFEDGLLANTIKNLVTLGIEAQEYEWVRTFLENYQHRIKRVKRPEDVYQYNMACYYFALKNFDKALECLTDSYDDVFYKIAAKRLEIKIYYEMRSDVLDAKMDAFKVYIFRLPAKLVLDYKRKSNNHFIDFLRQIRNPKTVYNASRNKKLSDKILQTKYLSDRIWLMEKLQEMAE